MLNLSQFLIPERSYGYILRKISFSPLVPSLCLDTRSFIHHHHYNNDNNNNDDDDDDDDDDHNNNNSI